MIRKVLSKGHLQEAQRSLNIRHCAAFLALAFAFSNSSVQKVATRNQNRSSTTVLTTKKTQRSSYATTIFTVIESNDKLAQKPQCYQRHPMQDKGINSLC